MAALNKETLRSSGFQELELDRKNIPNLVVKGDRISGSYTPKEYPHLYVGYKLGGKLVILKGHESSSNHQFSGHIR